MRCREMWSLIWIQPALQSQIHKVEFMLTLLYELVLFYLYLYLVEFIFKFIWEEYKFETSEHQSTKNTSHNTKQR